MSGVDGFEVLGQLARDRVAVPVIVITGHDTPGSRARALRGGAQAYLCKPVDDAVLLKAIHTALAP
jgi:CheY-like chemotaxis protein